MGRRSRIINGMLRKKPAHEKYFCFTCLKSGKGNPCGVQGHLYKSVSHKIHFPSYNASRTRWKEFIKAVDLYNWGSFRDDAENPEYMEAFRKALSEL